MLGAVAVLKDNWNMGSSKFSNELMYKEYRGGRRNDLRKYDWPTDLDPPPPGVALSRQSRKFRFRAK